MQTKPKYTVVVIPNDDKMEVSYFCSDNKIKDEEKKDFTNLIIQLDDCHCSYRISKKTCSDTKELEHIVQKTVINAKGHLC
ncbi:MAG: hypothetical protein H0W12_09290 [Chitinophagaceae bacterium]|nr:hypothetical protein [Chitinophagaceae bacterium]